MANPENLLQAFGQSYLEKQRSSPTFLRAPSEVNSKPLPDDRASRPISSAPLLLRSTKARRPRPTGWPPKPLANQGEEGETNTLDQERLASQTPLLGKQGAPTNGPEPHIAARTNGFDSQL